MQESIYLDNNATTWIDPLIADHVHKLALQGIANPASQHARGRQSQRLLDAAKTELLEWCGASEEGLDTAQAILTSGGTEANNLAVLGAAAATPGILIVASTDHPSVVEPAKQIGSAQYPPRLLKVGADGLVDLDQLKSWLKADAQRISLVSVMLGNNETGVIQDLAGICRLCTEYDIPVHSDVVQAVGKTPVNMRDIGLSAMTLTAHKIHGPVGIGALVVDKQFPLEATLFGGGQQFGMRPGTEPVASAVALAMSVRLTCQARLDGTYDRIATLRDRFEESLCSLTGASVIAADAPRLPHTSNLSFPGIDRQALLMALDLNGIACSTGSACSSGSSRPSGVLVAMGLPPETIAGSLRFSFSKFSTELEASTACESIARVVNKLLAQK